MGSSKTVMATVPQEVIDIAVLQSDAKTMKRDINEIKTDIKSILEKVDIEKLDSRYPTRRELAVLRWAVGILIAAVSALATLIMSMQGHVK